MSPSNPEVLVVGAGPVGLSTALLLGRAGVTTRVVDRHPALSRHPKAMGVHARTMELFRQWGLADDARGVGLPPERTQAVAWLTRLNGSELGTVSFVEDAQQLAEFAAQCPEPPLFAPQHRIEPLLAGAAVDTGVVDIALSTSVVTVSQDGDGVDVVLRGADGDERSVRSRFVVAADGARSPIRESHGFGELADEPYGQSVNIYFRADLDDVAAGRPYLLWWIVNPDIQGAFWPTDTHGHWIFNVEGDPTRPDSYYDAARCTGFVRQAAGVPDLDVEVLSVLRWQHEQAVADRWRIGRILLAGDAAHRFAPHGGFGMNSGIQDAANLAWKLAAVLKGQAGSALLDSYEDERRPVAVYNAEQVALNTKRMEQTGWLMSDPGVLADIESPAGEHTRRQFAEAIPAQREQFQSQGQQFGRIYESAAVVPDLSVPPESTVACYRPTTHPGARFPHLWLRDARSSIDLVGRGFTLLTRGAGPLWREAAGRVADELGVEIAVHDLGRERDVERLEVAPGGAVLVRPDAHVGYRCRDVPDDPAAELGRAMRTILARS